VPVPSLPRPWLIGIAVLYALFFLYAVLVWAQILLGLLLPALVIAVAYLGWRVWRLFELYESKLETETNSSNTKVDVDPIETLKERYAAGELTEAEFESELERRLEGEQGQPSTSVDDAARRDDGATERVDEAG